MSAVATVDNPVAAMHARLVAWGRIIIIGGKGPRQVWDTDPTRRYYEFTPAEQDAAYRLHILVGQLPEVRHRFVLPTFYRHIEAEGWDDLTLARRTELAGHMSEEVNKCIRLYARAERQHVPGVTVRDFDGIRLRAIRMLVNREAVI